MTRLSFALASLGLIGLSTLQGCAAPMRVEHRVDNAALPEAVRVPAGHMQSMHTTGSGEITYECREKKAGGGHEWAFVAPGGHADKPPGQGGRQVLRRPHLGGQRRLQGHRQAAGGEPGSGWQHPPAAGAGQPATGEGAMKGVSFIQRLKTVGGVAPALPCGAEQMGQKQVVPYRADYAFYKPAM